MAINDRLRRFLEEHQVSFQVLPHPEAFTSQEVAAASHVSGERLAKVLLLEDENRGYVMAVLPASCVLDLEALTALSGKQRLRLASEAQFAPVFPDCEPGAMPPFGNLYGMQVYLGACLRRDGDIYFQACNHHETVKMRCADYERIVQPIVGEFCRHAAGEMMGTDHRLEELRV